MVNMQDYNLANNKKAAAKAGRKGGKAKRKVIV